LTPIVPAEVGHTEAHRAQPVVRVDEARGKESDDDKRDRDAQESESRDRLRFIEPEPRPFPQTQLYRHLLHGDSVQRRFRSSLPVVYQ